MSPTIKYICRYFIYNVQLNHIDDNNILEGNWIIDFEYSLKVFLFFLSYVKFIYSYRCKFICKTMPQDSRRIWRNVLCSLC